MKTRRHPQEPVRYIALAERGFSTGKPTLAAGWVLSYDIRMQREITRVGVDMYNLLHSTNVNVSSRFVDVLTESYGASHHLYYCTGDMGHTLLRPVPRRELLRLRAFAITVRRAQLSLA